MPTDVVLAVYSGLQGPYETAGSPLGIVPNTRRTARTRHLAVDHQPLSARWKVKNSRRSATFVWVENDLPISGYQT